jgi:hypothetical protein
MEKKKVVQRIRETAKGREMKHLNASGAGGVARWVDVYPHTIKL